MRNMLFSDEAYFDLNGHVNSQNVRMYSAKRRGRPENLAHERFVSQKLHVFCGIRMSGLFGLRFFRNETMNAARYHSLLQYHVLPEIRESNGGNLANLTWTQDGAPCHTERRNIAYLSRQFGGRLVSKGADREWPPRSPDLNPYYIEREVRQLDPAMCSIAVLDIQTRADKCIDMGGKCFEK